MRALARVVFVLSGLFALASTQAIGQSYSNVQPATAPYSIGYQPSAFSPGMDYAGSASNGFSSGYGDAPRTMANSTANYATAHGYTIAYPTTFPGATGPLRRFPRSFFRRGYYWR